MKTMKHRGYAARIEYSEDDGCFVGHIAGIQDRVGFHGEAVDDHLDTCAHIGRAPQKPYSGNLMLRIRPETHAALASAAEVSGKSINQWASEVLERAAS